MVNLSFRVVLYRVPLVLIYVDIKTPNECIILPVLLFQFYFQAIIFWLWVFQKLKSFIYLVGWLLYEINFWEKMFSFGRKIPQQEIEYFGS